MRSHILWQKVSSIPCSSHCTTLPSLRAGKKQFSCEHQKDRKRTPLPPETGERDDREEQSKGERRVEEDGQIRVPIQLLLNYLDSPANQRRRPLLKMKDWWHRLREVGVKTVGCNINNKKNRGLTNMDQVPRCARHSARLSFQRWLMHGPAPEELTGLAESWEAQVKVTSDRSSNLMN